MASENFFLNKFFNLQHHSSPCPIENLTAKFCNILLNISRNRINGHVLWQIYYIAEKGEREEKSNKNRGETCRSRKNGMCDGII